MKDWLPDQMSETLLGVVWATLWALVGRLLYVTDQVRTGRRKTFLTWQTLWELMIAIGMGIIAGGLATYLGLTGLVYAGFISACSYLGPHFVDSVFQIWAGRQDRE